jgi:DMSO/TMAO reductase YedYZ molybdopterin-dependent catalytic subunit
VRFSGADGFSRTIPIAKATHADTLIVQIMNGEKLPAKHGFPVRTLVPGWYGMDSVKWLRSIELQMDDDGAVSGRHGYVRLTRTLLAGTRPAGAVTTMNVKSAFSRPVDGAILMGRRFMIRGAAWAGESTIKQVEVSTDSGAAWNTAQLTTKPAEYSWVLWSFEWKIPKAGEYDLIVRATDTQGRTQSNDRPSDRVDPYELNMQQRIRVIAV